MKENKNAFKNNINGNKKIFSNDNNRYKDIYFYDSFEKLKFLYTIQEKEHPVSDIISLNEMNYLTLDKKDFYIRTLGQKNKSYKESFEENSKINKIIFSSGKIILTLENSRINVNNEKSQTYSLKVGFNNNNNNDSKIQFISCSINNEPYDIIETGDIIILVGNNIIELFKIIQDNNNNNSYSITKISEIKLNENNDNNNNNNDDKLKILCIEKTDKYLICGHASGHISIWQPIQDYPFLKVISFSRIHIGAINRIIYDKYNDNTDVIISCSSDKTVKVHSIDDIVCFKVLNFYDEVIDIKKIIDYDEKPNYFLKLKNGNLMLYNSIFKKNFEITNQSNANIQRNVIYLNNVNNNNNEKNNNNNSQVKEKYILISENNKINVYKWIKEEEKKSNNNFYNNNNQFKGNNKYKTKNKHW